MKKALIIGISGQDGSFLAKLLIEKGYKVWGTSRDADLSSFNGLKRLGIYENVELLSMSLIDFRSVMQTILQIEPDEIYNLAGQSSVGLSFLQPVETLESISIGTQNILEVLRFHKLPIRFYNACSSECFGDTNGFAADENTPFRPRSPYAVAKSTSFWQISNYREAYNLFACSGLLFNHESYLRPKRFVTKKIIDSVCRIAKGEKMELVLGNVSIKRDWGWAPEYVEAMYLILQQDKADDYVIATGKNISLIEFVEKAFSYFNLDYNNFIKIDSGLGRPTDIAYSLGNPSKAEKVLGWKAKYFVEDVIRNMIEHELKNGK
jgi:GDPmannose 4,6-dehydratase